MKKIICRSLLVLTILYILLLIPEPQPDIPMASQGEAFAWNRDSYWNRLQKLFESAKDMNPSELDSMININLVRLDSCYDLLDDRNYSHEDSIFETIQETFFRTGALIANDKKNYIEYLSSYNRLRNLIKKQSKDWDINDNPVKNRIYRLLYGGRTALDEIIVQYNDSTITTLIENDSVGSETPSADLLGVEIHSGDILVSRGGAPTSALIARGSDYPGNFSHVALVHVDENSSEVSIIESHIEIGVAVANIEQYLKDKKLRILILRLDDQTPSLLNNPRIPHLAAAFALTRAQKERIPYDFEMNFKNHDKLFCSEVASAAYEEYDVTLWMGLSKISTPGIRSWLAAFGVKNFITQEPSDLEYDPQLKIVAEWRDFNTLKKDRYDNAVIDVMLEDAEKGERLDYDWYLLPIARLLKAYSWLKNVFGGVGAIPQGMSAAAALKNEKFSAKHDLIKEKLLLMVKDYEQKQGYCPPYWVLVQLAGKAKNTISE